MTVYLSGKITGDKHFKKKFLKAKVKLVSENQCKWAENRIAKAVYEPQLDFGDIA